MVPWDALAEAQRRSYAEQCDLKADPARSGEHTFWWRHICREHDIERAIKEWESRAANTVTELSTKQERIAELRAELVNLKEGLRSVPDLLTIRYTDADRQSVPVPPAFISYAQAFKSLFERYEATPHEFAMWIWLGGRDGGLDAYSYPHDSEDPQRFRIGYWVNMDYVSPITACWFNAEEIANFVPAKRFIRSRALVEKWTEKPGMSEAGCVEAFIRAQIAGERLIEIHPIAGFTQWTYPGNSAFPPSESAMFVLSDVEAIEASHFDFQSHAQPSESAGGRSEPVQAWKIMTAFAVERMEDENVAWWRPRMRNALRGGLADCRASLGRRGVLDSSRWYPDLVAAWLVEGERLSAATTARMLRANFPDCADAADQLEDLG